MVGVLSLKQAMESSEQKMTAQVWIVSSPIGNLGDLSDRAKSILSAVDCIYCEDTRRTQALLSAIGIRAKTKRLDENCQKNDYLRAIDQAKSGNGIAFVTDAGTPGVSDPGSKLVQAAYASKLRVSFVPGPSAVTALVALSPWTLKGFWFRGFFPREKKPQEAEAELLQNGTNTLVVYFESPKRILKTLEAIESSVGECEVLVAKELTKMFERVFHGPIARVRLQVQDHVEEVGEIGEWVFGIYVNSVASEGESEDWVNILHHALESGADPKRCVSHFGQAFGISRNQIYESILAWKKSTSGT